MGLPVPWPQAGQGGLAGGPGARLAAAKTGFWPEMSVTSVGWGLGFVFEVRNPYGRTLRRCRSRGGLRYADTDTVRPRAARGPGISGRGLAFSVVCFLKKSTFLDF